MKALIFLETKDGAPVGASLECWSAARALGAEICAVTVAACEGVPDEEAVVEALSQKASADGFDVVLLSATTLGKMAAPRIAARLEAGSVNDALHVEVKEGKLAVIRPAFGGTVQEEIRVETEKAVITLRGGSYAAPEEEVASEEIPVPCAENIRVRVKEVIAEAGEAVNLEDAKVIVTGGRGMGTAEDFRLCEELAEVLGGVVGATRPAIESGWAGRTHQVGQSGKIVTPDLYIACGVSGATQHISGMTGSKYIIAINTAEDAPIFSVADVGIVGDVKQILPLLIEEFRKRRA